MAFTAGHVDFICYNEDNTTFPEATVMGWGATQVYNHAKKTNGRVCEESYTKMGLLSLFVSI
jgi:hypothetical protein